MAGRQPYTSLTEVTAITDTFNEVEQEDFTGILAAGSNQFIDILAPENYRGKAQAMFITFQKPSGSHGATAGTYKVRIRLNNGGTSVAEIEAAYNATLEYSLNEWFGPPTVTPSEVEQLLVEKIELYFTEDSSLRFQFYNNTDVSFDLDSGNNLISIAVEYEKIA